MNGPFPYHGKPIEMGISPIPRLKRLETRKGVGSLYPSRDESPGLLDPAAFDLLDQRAEEPRETRLLIQPHPFFPRVEDKP